jgi:hypothetical protein
LLIFPIAVITENTGKIYQLTQVGLLNFIENKWVLADKHFLSLIYVSINLLATIVTLFLYKYRKVQIILSRILIVINVLLILLFLLEITFWLKDLEIQNTKYSWPLLIPVFSVILLYLSIKSLKRDEELVKSIDRLR